MKLTELTELRQVNAIIGLSKQLEGWPSTLLELGYELERLELSLSLASAKPGVTEKVTPDLFFLAELRNYSLLVELKSGTFQGFAQPDKLVRVTPKDLILSGRVSARMNYAAHQISVAVIISEEHLSEYQAEFRRVNHQASVISISDSLIKSQHGALADGKADRAFKDGIDISFVRWPTKLIPILPTSDEKYDLAVSVLNAFKYFWLNNEYSITPQNIAQQVFRPIWGAIDSAAQAQYLTAARKTLRDMSETEFRAYMRPIPAKADEYKLLKLPGDSEPRHQTRAKKTFQRAVTDYRQRKLHNKKFSGVTFAQPNLLDTLDEPLPEPGNHRSSSSYHSA